LTVATEGERAGLTTVWFGILGPLEVRAGDRLVPLNGQRMERALAALLLDAGQVVTIDHLVDVVWDEPPSTAPHQVRDLVTRLRRILVGAGAPADIIATRRGGYLLRLEADSLDAHTFDRMVTSARDVAGTQAATAVATLRRALGLWRGEPLAGIRGPLVDTAARIWCERRLAVREECLTLELALGHYHDTTSELVALVAKHPLRESLVGLLMEALVADGRRSDALDAFHALRKRLADEMGIDPSCDLQRLYTVILRAEPQPSPQPTAAQAGDVPAQLPLGVYGFTGRTSHVAQLDALLESAGGQSTALVVAVLSGTAGVGKTALAVHWAHRVRHAFPDGQLYVNLRGFDPARTPIAPGEAIREFLDALHVPAGRVPVTVDAQIGLYRSLLAGKRILIMLDNARDAEQVRPLLPGAPGCLAVVTSRSRLASLVATEGARPIALDLLSVEEARDLLAHRIGPALVAAEPVVVEDIIASCARLPLALAIAAARATTSPDLPLAGLATELRGTPGRLDAFDSEDVVTQVRAVFSWSYHTLSPDAARLFRLLGLNVGIDLAAPAAAGLAGVSVSRVRPLLSELIRAHLITEHVPGRYTFHDLLRAYAAELAHTTDVAADRTAATHRIIDHYLHTARAAALLLEPRRDPIDLPSPLPGVVPEQLAGPTEALDWFTAEHATLLAAIPDAAAARFDTHAWALAWTLTTFVNRSGHWDRFVTVQHAALEAARRLTDRTGQAHIHRNLGLAYAHLGRHDDAYTELRQALDLADALGDRSGQANIHHNLAWVFDRQGSHSRALNHVLQALDLYHAVGHRAGEARTLNAAGWFHSQLGEYQQALTHCQRALAVLQEVGDRAGQANAWDSIGYAHHHLGDHDQAEACYQRALDLFREDGDRYHEAETLTHLGDTYHAANDTDSARHTWQRALNILNNLGHASATQVRAKLSHLDGQLDHQPTR
jgi:DNA-binding SARP family transcriptional activator/tetratricopeptide (TPR) repeat protein